MILFLSKSPLLGFLAAVPQNSFAMPFIFWAVAYLNAKYEWAQLSSRWEGIQLSTFAFSKFFYADFMTESAITHYFKQGKTLTDLSDWENPWNAYQFIKVTIHYELTKQISSFSEYFPNFLQKCLIYVYKGFSAKRLRQTRVKFKKKFIYNCQNMKKKNIAKQNMVYENK